MLIKRSYALGAYEEDWTKQDYFCPNCGQKEVWAGGLGDYYAGQEHICTACRNEFYFYSSPSPATGKPADDLIKVLKETTC